jgi:hypothetical protein
MMNRSLNLLRPLGVRGLMTPRTRPTAILRTPLSAQSQGLTLRKAYASKTGQEGVTSGSSGSAEVSKANPNVDHQNATSSAKEEVCFLSEGDKKKLITRLKEQHVILLE